MFQSFCREHQSPILTFCYQKNCQLSDRRLCVNCMIEKKHSNHSITSLQLQSNNSLLMNLSRNSHQNQSLQRELLQQQLSLTLQKPLKLCSKIKQYCDKIEVGILQQLQEIIIQSMFKESSFKALSIIYNSQSTKQDLEKMANRINNMSKPHIANEKLLIQSLKMMKNQVQKVVKELEDIIISQLKKFHDTCKEWSIFNDKNWVEILSNQEKKDKLLQTDNKVLNKEQFGDELNQFVNFAINQKYTPIKKWIVTGHKIEDIQELKLWGDNFGDKIFEKTIGGSNIRKIPKLNVLTKLKRLELTFNFIERIENIDKLTSLTLLALANNHITKIQNLDTLTSLKILGLGNNRIQRIENIDKLQSLSVCFLLNNNIEKIENLQNLRELTQLYLNGNKISKIQNLNKLKSLSKLYLSDNQIKRVQNLTGLNKLGMIELQNNPLIKDDLNVNEILYLKEQNTHVKHSLN